MPLISDILKETERKKKFQKKAYRPWDDEISLPPENLPENVGVVEEVKVFAQEDEKLYLIMESLVNENNNADASYPIISSGPEKNSGVGELDLEKLMRDLYGAQRIIFKFLINLPVQKKDDLYVTGPIAANEIVLSTKLPVNTIKTVIGRLKIKNLLDTYENKPGRGGYGRYSFSNEIYSFFVKCFSET